MTDDTETDLMVAQLRELSRRMEIKQPIDTVRLALREVDPKDPEVLFSDLPPRKFGGCDGAWS